MRLLVSLLAAVITAFCAPVLAPLPESAADNSLATLPPAPQEARAADALAVMRARTEGTALSNEVKTEQVLLSHLIVICFDGLDAARAKREREDAAAESDRRWRAFLGHLSIMSSRRPIDEFARRVMECALIHSMRVDRRRHFQQRSARRL